MRCPNCKLFNSAGALRCDCGYDFPSGLMKDSYLPRPEVVRNRAAARNRLEYRAFLAVPFVASGVWYLLTLVNLAAMNGRLRARTDVLAMAIGAVTVGLVVAMVATLVVAVPLYWIVRRVASVRLRAALGVGISVGILLTGVFWMLEGRLWSALFTPVHGILGGLVTATVWWHVAGRPGPDTAPRLA